MNHSAGSMSETFSNRSRSKRNFADGSCIYVTIGTTPCHCVRSRFSGRHVVPEASKSILRIPSLGERFDCGWSGIVVSQPVTRPDYHFRPRRAHHYAEGQVWLDSQGIETESPELTRCYRVHIQEHQHLRTSAGRAEVVLAPGSILRVGEKSQVQMLSSRIHEVRLRLIQGDAIIEIAEISGENSISVLCAAAVVQFRKAGSYRLDVQPGGFSILKVFQGQARVAKNGIQRKVGSKRSIELAGRLGRAARFDPADGDSLNVWNRHRAGVLAQAAASKPTHRKTWSPCKALGTNFLLT